MIVECLMFFLYGFQGPANKGTKCDTCGGAFDDCPGHFGYLTLALPVYNVGFLPKTLEVLKAICKVLT